MLMGVWEDMLLSVYFPHADMRTCRPACLNEQVGGTHMAAGPWTLLPRIERG